MSQVSTQDLLTIIGDLHVQLAVAQAEIQKLRDQITEMEDSDG